MGLTKSLLQVVRQLHLMLITVPAFVPLRKRLPPPAQERIHLAHVQNSSKDPLEAHASEAGPRIFEALFR